MSAKNRHQQNPAITKPVALFIAWKHVLVRPDVEVHVQVHTDLFVQRPHGSRRINYNTPETDPSISATVHDEEDEKRPTLEPLAIIGIGFEFPGGAVTEDALWDIMVGGKCVSSDFPQDRMNIDAFHSAEPGKSHTVSHAGLAKNSLYADQEPRFTPRKVTSLTRMSEILTHPSLRSLQLKLLLWIHVIEV